MIFTSNSEIMPASGGFSLSVCAGLCAALASVSSKLALDQNGTTIKLAVPCNWLSKQNCFFVRVCISLGSILSLSLHADGDSAEMCVCHINARVQCCHVGTVCESSQSM